MSKDNLDKIYIRDLHVRCIIGIYPEERTTKQDLLINVTLEVNLAPAGVSDDIKDTVDYKRLKKRIMGNIESSEFFLIERVAQEVAEICLGTHGVLGVHVTIDKPGALRFARSVAVEISRRYDAKH